MTTTAATSSVSGTSPTRDETSAPDDVQRAWDALWASVDAGVAVLRPGAAGWEVDAAARESLVAAGYPEPMYALGHQLGRAAHDGGTVLAPRWDRYGAAPFGLVEKGNVFTLEYGTAVPGRGYIGLEEDVLVTADGVEWLSIPAARAVARALRRRPPPPVAHRLARGKSACAPATSLVEAHRFATGLNVYAFSAPMPTP